MSRLILSFDDIAGGAESLLGIDFDFPMPQMCPDCGLRELADSFREPFKCDVPVLFVSGSFDGRTPPSNVEETIEGFSRAHHLIIEGSGHGHELFISSPKIKELELEFMSKGTVSMDRIQLPRMVFQGFADTPPNVTR